MSYECCNCHQFQIHGLVYEIGDGKLKELNIDFASYVRRRSIIVSSLGGESMCIFPGRWTISYYEKCHIIELDDADAFVPMQSSVMLADPTISTYLRCRQSEKEIRHRPSVINAGPSSCATIGHGDFAKLGLCQEI
jgi:hypothetical protein